MATIVNIPPGNTEDSGNSVLNIIIILLIVIALVWIFFIYGLPMLESRTNTSPDEIDINIDLPVDTESPSGTDPVVVPPVDSIF